MIHLRGYDSRYTKKEFIESVIQTSSQLFNEAFGIDMFQKNNLKTAFCDSENQAVVYEEFCGQFFPLYLREEYSRTDPFAAQAFTNMDDGIYGILVCLDTEHNSNEWYQIILHELSHIYCITHEIDGENFSDKYSKSNIEDWAERRDIGVGYNLWREFIANYIADQINPLTHPLTLKDLREVVREYDRDVSWKNPDHLQCLSLLLQYIFLSPRIQAAEDADAVVRTLEKNRIFVTKVRCEQYEKMVRLIFGQLQHDFYWKIDLEFIKNLGLVCIWVMM